MDGVGMKGEYNMYHYLQNKEFLHHMRTLSGKIMQDLCHQLKKDYHISANAFLTGSGAKNLITQNSNEAVDLDYNLEIIKCENFNDCQYLKECVRKTFNKILKTYGLPECEDSTSVLTSKKMSFQENRIVCPMQLLFSNNETIFSIDIGIIKKDKNGNYHRLIHEKTGFISTDKYYWNIAPNSNDLNKKVNYIKKHGKWTLVREQYLMIKNNYLKQNDHNHSSFICYIEAVNNIYQMRNH